LRAIVDLIGLESRYAFELGKARPRRGREEKYPAARIAHAAGIARRSLPPTPQR